MRTPTYLGEFRQYWRNALAASLGLAAGYNLTIYLNNIFTPSLLRDFGWSKSQFSLVGVSFIFTAIFNPFAGRLTDRLGVKPVAGVGIVAAPLIYCAYGLQNGSVSIFTTIAIVQAILLGITTTPVVYGRLIAETFRRARGFALAIAASAPALLGAMTARPLSSFIDSHGWRAGYAVLACFTAMAGVAVLILIEPRRRRDPAPSAAAPPNARRDYGVIFAAPAFWIIVAGMFLCNLPLMMQSTQLKVIFLERGLDSSQASLLIALYAATVVVGRLFFGLALDRLPTHLVVAFVMALPSLSLLFLSTGRSWYVSLAASAALLGLSLGAEGDIVAYVVMKFFPLQIFGSVLGLVGASVAFSGAFGSLLLSMTQRVTGSYSTFLVLSGLAVATGGSLFLLLGHARLTRLRLPDV